MKNGEINKSDVGEGSCSCDEEANHFIMENLVKLRLCVEVTLGSNGLERCWLDN